MRDFGTMPKVELHLHLEGAIPLNAMWELVAAKSYVAFTFVAEAVANDLARQNIVYAEV
jgi:adenosine deaminase